MQQAFMPTCTMCSRGQRHICGCEVAPVNDARLCMRWHVGMTLVGYMI